MKGKNEKANHRQGKKNFTNPVSDKEFLFVILKNSYIPKEENK